MHVNNRESCWGGREWRTVRLVGGCADSPPCNLVANHDQVRDIEPCTDPLRGLVARGDVQGIGCVYDHNIA